MLNGEHGGGRHLHPGPLGAGFLDTPRCRPEDEVRGMLGRPSSNASRQGDLWEGPMTDDREHSYIPTLKRQLAERRIDRREFLRTATLLGMAAPAAYALAGTLSGSGSLLAPARAQGAIPKGGTIRIGM